ncbi:class I SAM-dependent methyltransferase [Micromonospora sp. WP24]|uniref:class I SAM-dependent methyltransferase n=1 Tax=Micromonospora sp. WP24 TaxID=2604469 RepID=UPI0011D65CE8|nr:class I SAM-dependent methyltransferase [Micromonospora sp. WP24]TYB96016.1 class I SAM-dependent methyltransferase [Micromonospora sp. WP24]
MRHREFEDPRLVQVYDAECTWGPDDDFFLAAVGETPGARVLDLGCGTGRLTVALAAAGHPVTGVDPAHASLAAARRKPGADRVTWVEGTSAALPTGAYDVAVMTSHVAQFFATRAQWAATLGDLRRALVPGGRLFFDSRDPADRRWERWNPVDSRRRVTLPDGREVRAWTEVTAISEGTVGIVHHYVLPDREELSSAATLRFRSERELRDSLLTAGFSVEHVFGGWRREPVGAGDGELVVVARASGSTTPL